MCVVHYKPERTPKRPTFIISTEDTGPPKICLFMPVDQRRHIEFPMLGAVPHQSGSIFASQPPSWGLSNKDGASNSPRRLGIFYIYLIFFDFTKIKSRIQNGRNSHEPPFATVVGYLPPFQKAVGTYRCPKQR
jgi:hypothetical protein